MEGLMINCTAMLVVSVTLFFTLVIVASAVEKTINIVKRIMKED